MIEPEEIWELFKATGNIEVYRLFKDIEREKLKVAGDSTDDDKNCRNCSEREGGGGVG